MAAAAIGLFLLSVLLMVHVNAKGADAGAAGNVSYQARENDAYSVGLQAYIYGLAPVTMEQTEQKMVTTPGMAPAGNKSNCCRRRTVIST